MQQNETPNLFNRIWRTISGRTVQNERYYQPIGVRHSLNAGKLNKLRKRRAKNKMARATRQKQRAAAKR